MWVAWSVPPAGALLDVGRPPRGVQMVDRHTAALHVDAGAQLVGGAQQHRDPAGAAVREQLRPVRVGRGVVDEADLVGGHASVDEARADLAVHLEVRRVWRALVAEHDLQGAADRRDPAAGVRVGPLGRALPGSSDPGDQRIHLPGRAGKADQRRIQGDPAAVPGHLEHVVVVGVNAAGVDGIGALHQPADVGALLVGWRHDHRVPLDPGARQVQHPAGAEVGHLGQQPAQPGKVDEPPRPVVGPEPAAVGRDLHPRPEPHEHARPRVGRVQPKVPQPLLLEQQLQHVGP